ncbi:MAG: hypothetical protein LBG89_02240 [Rickettsiales bacterium]|jgi:hypothetical protein|nr:hypothetical protein [Rickettsiales bacterium]
MPKIRTPKTITRFDMIQQTLADDLKKSLIKGETIRYDFAKYGAQMYNGYDVQYTDLEVMDYLNEAKKEFKKDKMGRLEEIYFRTIDPALYAGNKDVFPFDHTPEYAKSKSCAFTLKAGGIIAPWLFAGELTSLAAASKYGLAWAALCLATDFETRNNFYKGLKDMRALGR